MRTTQFRNGVLIMAGILVGVVAVQLLWPPAGEAQGPPDFVLQAQVPNHEQKVRTFRSIKPNLPPARQAAIAAGFSMQGQPTDRGGVFTLDQGSKSLRIMGDTGAMSYVDGSKFATAGAKNLPNAGQAGAQAARFVQDNNLLPQEAQRGTTEVVSLQKQTQAGGRSTAEAQEVHVNYRFRLGGKEVEGPGAKATLIIGEGGEVIGFAKAWREVEQGREVTTRSGNDAVAQLRRKGAWNMLRQPGGQVKNVRITRARAAFWAEDLGRAQAEIEPCYIFEGTIQRGDGVDIPFMQKVSALADKAEPTLPASPGQPARPQD